MSEGNYTIELTKTGNDIVINTLKKDGSPIAINAPDLIELSSSLGFGKITQKLDDTSLNTEQGSSLAQVTGDNKGQGSVPVTDNTDKSSIEYKVSEGKQDGGSKKSAKNGRKYSKRNRKVLRKSLKK